MEKITVITCPGTRPEAFALCEKFMQRQTYKGIIQWLIIDDGYPEIEAILKCQEYHRGPKRWEPGINTQRLNLDYAMQFIKGDAVFIWEEDDYYAPNYLEVYCDFLKYAPVVGECYSKYYNIEHLSYKEQFNTEHTSLCQTAVRSDQFKLLYKAINSGDKFIDIDLWKKVKERNIPSILFSGLNTCVGMKGLPGREGIGSGHKPIGYVKDISFLKLKTWIGDDYKLYEKLVKTHPKYNKARMQQFFE